MARSFFSKTTLYFRRFLAYTGPGYLIAVGYMDPGNWATGLASGSAYGYALLSIILISSLMAMLLQFCALKLDIATGKDLARACRDYYSPGIARFLWILAELAVIATDLAEVIGSAIGLKLLFGIPIIVGVCITGADVLLLLLLAHNHMKIVEILVAALIGAVSVCFGIIIFLSQPNWIEIVKGFVPTQQLFHDTNMLYLAIGILGATVMPHNLYLHSFLLKKSPKESEEKKGRLFGLQG